MKSGTPVLEVKPSFNALGVESLGLSVRLGCSREERLQPQEVRVSVEFRFPEAPLGTQTDALEDTICYAKVSRVIQQHCESREYQLVEKIAHEIYGLLRVLSGSSVEIGISVHKVRPPVENLRGGTFFRCGDFAL